MYNISCPSLSMKLDYDMKDQLGSKNVDEKGNCVVSFGK